MEQGEQYADNPITEMINPLTGRYNVKNGSEWTTQYIVVVDYQGHGVKNYHAKSFQTKQNYHWKKIPGTLRRRIEKIWAEWGSDPRRPPQPNKQKNQQQQI